jgi:hypothetical protein
MDHGNPGHKKALEAIYPQSGFIYQGESREKGSQKTSVWAKEASGRRRPIITSNEVDAGGYGVSRY